MLAKQNRLSTREFEKVFKGGKSVHTDNLLVKYLPNPIFQAGISVSKKIHKTAVARNHRRRQLYGAIRTYLDVPALVVVIMKKGSQDVSYQQLVHELETAFKKIYR